MERRRTSSAIDALKLIKFAVSVNPNTLPIQSKELRASLELRWEDAGLKPSYEYATREKLWQGMSDTRAIIHNALDDHLQIVCYDDALTIAHHPVSIDTVANAAKFNEKYLRYIHREQRSYNELVKRNKQFPNEDASRRIGRDSTYSRRYIIDDTAGAIVQNPYLERDDYHNLERGCPFTYSSSEISIASRPRIFDTFVRWSGTIAVRDYYK